jgi:hypothetical protein
MKVLADYHHISLLRSIYILFKERLNYELDIPSGWDWYFDGSVYSNYSQEVGRYTITPELDNTYFKKYLPHIGLASYEKFKDNYYDVVVCTLLENYHSWQTLIKQYDLRCKLIFQIGNNIPLWAQPTKFENILSSSWPCYVQYPCQNKVFYHQEFDTTKFRQELNCNRKSIANLQHFMQMPELFYGLEKDMPDYTFKAHGAGNRDGYIYNGEDEMAQFIRNLGFLFHCKIVDEGYGHNVHNAFACGKPVITDSTHMGVDWNGWIGNTASLMFEDGKTIIDVNGKSQKEIEFKIREMTENYEEVSNYIIKKFNTVSNFDEEFIAIKSFMANLV